MTATNGHNGFAATNGHNGFAAANGHNSFAATSAATKLRRLLEESSDIIVCPGVYDGLSARIALSIGFSAMYMV